MEDAWIPEEGKRYNIIRNGTAYAVIVKSKVRHTYPAGLRLDTQIPYVIVDLIREEEGGIATPDVAFINEFEKTP
jgi:hypothetical protein